MQTGCPKGLVALGGYSCLIGLLDMSSGAARESRFYAIDDVVVRVLGGALLVLGVAVVLRRAGALWPLTVLYVLSILEIVVTGPSALLFGAFFFVLPLIYLLRHLFPIYFDRGRRTGAQPQEQTRQDHVWPPPPRPPDA